VEVVDMKRRNINVVLPWLALLLALGASPSPAGGKGGLGKLVRHRLQKLGFQVGAVKLLEDNLAAVKIKGFTQQVETVSLAREFKPFSIRVILEDGVLLVDRDVLVKRGFKLKGENLAFGVKAVGIGKKGPPIIVGKGVTKTSPSDPAVEDIEVSLAKAKVSYAKVYDMAGQIKDKAQEAGVMLDGCKAPSAKEGQGTLTYELLPLEPLAGSGMSSDPCSYHAEEAKMEEDYCMSMVGHVAKLLKKTTKSVKTIKSRCESKGMSEEDKTGWRNDLGDLLDAAVTSLTHVKESIERIDKLLEAQEKCAGL
jgi:hypothetical protein